LERIQQNFISNLSGGWCLIRDYSLLEHLSEYIMSSPLMHEHTTSVLRADIHQPKKSLDRYFLKKVDRFNYRNLKNGV